MRIESLSGGHEEARPQINYSRLSVGGNAAGLLCTLVVLIVALAGLPATRVFLAAAIPVGLIFALIRHLTSPN